MKPSDLWNWKGSIGRGAYVVWGVILFAVKFNLDRLVLRAELNTEWGLADYIRWNFPSPDLLPATMAQNAGLLIVVSIPFLWAGTILSLQRLRSARLPLGLVCLFVVPVVKWFFFLMLALMPVQTGHQAYRHIEDEAEAWWLRLLPKSRFGSALAAILITSLLAGGAVALATTRLATYGWGLFFGLPWLAGFLAAVLYGWREPRTLGASIGVACLSITVLGVGVLMVALEGAICLVMASPIAYALAMVGGLCGHAALPDRRRQTPPRLFCISLLAMPFMIGAEYWHPAPAEVIAVRTAIEVNAPPVKVWQHVVTFSELPPPQELMFKAGIAYPLRAEIKGNGPGAVRHCVFSTGPFVEPITVWDEPRLLAFDVTQNPAPMQEWTPYNEIHPPHLHGFLVSKHGQFQLTPLANGGTLLEGTTWYSHGLWPAKYWQLWSDQIIHTIHLRVLNHVKNLSEEKQI